MSLGLDPVRAASHRLGRKGAKWAAGRVDLCRGPLFELAGRSLLMTICAELLIAAEQVRAGVALAVAAPPLVSCCRRRPTVEARTPRTCSLSSCLPICGWCRGPATSGGAFATRRGPGRLALRDAACRSRAGGRRRRG